MPVSIKIISEDTEESLKRLKSTEQDILNVTQMLDDLWYKIDELKSELTPIQTNLTEIAAIIEESVGEIEKVTKEKK